MPRLPRNLYRLLALAFIWLTVAPVATYLVSGQTTGPNQSTTPMATSNPSPTPLTATAPQAANTTATTTQPSGVQANSLHWATPTVTTTQPSDLAGLVTPRNPTFSAVTTSPRGSMPSVTSQTVQLSDPTSAKPTDCLPGVQGSNAWSEGQLNVDVNADGSPDPVHFVLTIFPSNGSIVSVDISSDDSTFCETFGGLLNNGITGTEDDERLTASGTLVRLGAFYAFQLVFGYTGSYPSPVYYHVSITASTWYVANVAGTDLDGDGSAADAFYAAITDTDSDGIFDRLDLSVGDDVFGEGNLSDGIVDYSATDNINDERLSGSAYVRMGANTFYFTFDDTPAGAVVPGAAWAWGDNSQGQLGDGTWTNRATPVHVSGLSGVSRMAGGLRHSLALKSDGTVWAWGRNDYGQLGVVTPYYSTTPVHVSGLTGVTAIAAGDNHSLALASDGTVWAWGLNSYGQLGDGTSTNRYTPVSTLTGVTAIAAGGWHSLALKADGSVWAWGYNGQGQLGNGTNSDRLTPVQVSGLTGVTAIAAGHSHSLALKSDGTLRAWGWNSYGQLGNGFNSSKSTPVQVKDSTGTSYLAGVSAVAGGYSHSLALGSDGIVWAWGDNGYGQLGNDSISDGSSTPVRVSSLANVTGVAAGSNHSLALIADGTVRAWGVDGHGQLGDGSTIENKSTPVEVSGLSGASAIAAGYSHSLAAAPAAAPVAAMTLSPAWYQGTFTIDVDANGSANDTVNFVLSDTDSDGLYDTMDLSTDDGAFGEGTLSGQVPLQTGANDDERLGMSNAGASAVVRLGDYYTFTVAFVNNPAAGGDVASITSKTWYTGSFTIDSDGDEASDDTVYFVLSDTDSDGRYDTMDIETDDGPGSPTTLGEGTLSGQSPRQTGINDDERLGIGTGGGNAGGSADVRLGLHGFAVAFDNNPAALADNDDARLTSRWYGGTLDGRPFVQVSPTSNGLYTVLEYDANGSNSHDASEVSSSSPANISIGGSQATLAYRSNPTTANSATLSGSSAAAPAQVAPPPSDQAGAYSNVQNLPASQLLAQEAEQARQEADAQDAPEYKLPIPALAAEPPPVRITRDINNQPLARDEVVVTLDPDLPDPERRIRQIAFATGATFLGSVAVTRTYQLQFQVADLAGLDRIIARLEGFTGVDSASHHYLLDELARTPNDPQYPSWDEAAGDGWDLRAMRAPQAWDATTGNPSLRIAVIDADFDRNHEDLRDNVASISAPKRTKAGGHGTHVAGTICARGDNAIGVAGVVWDCSLALYDFGGSSPVKAQEAMIAAVQSGARIINMSLQWVDNNQCGTVGTPATSRKVQEVNNILKGALDYARREGRDVLWVFAAGNECRDTRYASPASLVRTYPDNVIVVSSIGPSGDLSYFANYGDLVTVVAPGEDILSTLPSNDYGLLSGTSMATPHVSGLAALIMSRRPALSANQVKQCITGSAQPSSRVHRYKLVNAAEAVRCGQGAPSSRPQGIYGGG